MNLYHRPEPGCSAFKRKNSVPLRSVSPSQHIQVSFYQAIITYLNRSRNALMGRVSSQIKELFKNFFTSKLRNYICNAIEVLPGEWQDISDIRWF